MIPGFAEPRRRAPQPLQFAFGSIAGTATQATVETVFQPAIVLASIAFLIGGSTRLVVSFVVVSALAWAIASLAALSLGKASYIPAELSWILAGITGIAALLVGYTAWRIDSLTAGSISRNLLVAWVIYQASIAFGTQLFGRSPGRDALAFGYQSLLSWRRLGAVILSLGGSFIVWRLFDANISFESILGRVVALAFLAMLATAWFQAANGRDTSVAHIADSSVTEALGNRGFRRFALFKLLLALAAAVDPLLIVYGFQKLNLDIRYIGVAVLAWAIGQTLGFVFWSRWISMAGPRVPLQFSAVFRLLLLLWMISLPTILESKAYTDRFDGTEPIQRGFAIGFVLLGLAGSVGTIGNQQYLIAIASRAVVSNLVLASNVLAAIAAILPWVAVAILHQTSIERVLWFAAGASVAALFASGLLVDTHVIVKSAPGRWRSRRGRTSTYRIVRART